MLTPPVEETVALVNTYPDSFENGDNSTSPLINISEIEENK